MSDHVPDLPGFWKGYCARKGDIETHLETMVGKHDVP
jgi:hypothetical protein